MDVCEYQKMREIQDRHWLWEARRKILCALIEGHVDLSRPLRIADLGCGYGANIPALLRYGSVTGLEPFEGAVQFVREHFEGKAEALLWTMPEPLEQRLDLITLIDVLEHIQDDASAVKWLAGHLETGGYILITVPAHQQLWTQIDEAMHHYRRYNRRMLLNLFGHPFEIVHLTYYNFFLLPLKLAFVLYDRMKRWLRPDAPRNSCHGIPPAPVNEFCKGVNAAEAAFIRMGGSFPAGASLALLARKRGSGFSKKPASAEAG